MTFTCVAAFCGALSACACVAIAGAPLHALLATAALAFGAPSMLRLLGLSPDSVRWLEWAPDGQWHIRTREGTRDTVILLPASSVVGPLVLLVFRNSGGRRNHVLLTASSAGRYSFRLLRSRLRLEAVGAHRSAGRYC
jgi:hypothetical protein